MRSELGRGGDGSTQAGIRCLKVKKEMLVSPPSADAFAAQDHTLERKEAGKKGKEGVKENGGHWH